MGKLRHGTTCLTSYSSKVAELGFEPRESGPQRPGSFSSCFLLPPGRAQKPRGCSLRVGMLRAQCAALGMPPWNVCLPASSSVPISLSMMGPRRFFKKPFIRLGLRRAGWARGVGTGKGSSRNQRPALKGSEWPWIPPWCSNGVLFSCRDLCSWSQSWTCCQ